MKVPELRTERLLLRGFRDDDIDAWAVITADPEVTRCVGDPDGLTRERAWRLMAYFAGHWELRGCGQCGGAGGGVARGPAPLGPRLRA